MNLYDINQALIDTIEMGVDVETGEILEGQNLDDKINQLSMVLDEKMENIACYVKNLTSDIEALKTEEDNLKKRRKSKENQIKYLKRYLSNFMQLNDIPKFETSKCKVSFRKSVSTEVIDQDKIPKSLIKTKTEKTVDKLGLKQFLQNNTKDMSKEEQIKEYGAYLSENKNIGIK